MNDLDRMRAAADKIGPKAGGSGVMADINAAIASYRDNDTSGEYQTVQRVPGPEVHVSDEDAWKRIDGVDAAVAQQRAREASATERKLRLLAETKAEAIYWRKRAEAAEAYMAGLLQS